MSGSIKPRLDRRVAKALNAAYMAAATRGCGTWREMDEYVAPRIVRVVARELPPIQAARLLRAAGIEQKGKKG